MARRKLLWSYFCLTWVTLLMDLGNPLVDLGDPPPVDLCDALVDLGDPYSGPR